MQIIGGPSIQRSKLCFQQIGIVFTHVKSSFIKSPSGFIVFFSVSLERTIFLPGGF